ncbi:MAG: UDP-N-acetylmuramoyl-tripeptide--D-alanyl-D-alanine ligase [Actinomycetales bacterium]|nr:UDP-N-acetylmuramoyl-tripeptide--D-alanyl-D-alanine ligase [Actinomycetales bacterium]
MIALTVAEIAGILGAHPDSCPGTPVVDSVVIDSRLARPGSLFVALPGTRTDGHDHCAHAHAAGAVAAVVTRPIAGVPCLVLPAGDDGLTALATLAGAVRGRVADLAVIAVTGSSGKTSTKDLLVTVLGGSMPTVGARASANNEIGLPLTVLQVCADTRALVVEMGARRPGNIAQLCAIARPTHSVVTNVGHAHIEIFGSLAATTATKGEIVAALDAQGVAILNHDDPRVRSMAARCAGEVVWFGRGEGAAIRAVDIRTAPGGSAFTLITPDASVAVELPLAGGHQVDNALAAAGVGWSLGLSATAIAEALADAAPRSPHRMAVHERADGVIVIDDAYNANPESMAAALGSLVTIAAGRPTVAVLGEMAELGEHSQAAHARLGELATALGIRTVIVVGPATEITRGYPAAICVAGIDDALSALDTILRPDSVVLCKASRVVGLERVAAALLHSAREDDAS